tara:strand:+ start:16373 stop:16957 length:585 start_codon:yes stop_codon:yes gene_type:complete
MAELEHVQYVKSHPFGNLEMGQECLDGVITGIGLQGRNSIHYIHLDATGVREGWTLMRNPGVFEIKCGDTVNPQSTAIDIEALNGDIRLTASNGRIILSAKDIDIMANGEDNTRGHIKIEANQDIKCKASGSFDLIADTGYRLYTPHVGKIIANTELFMVSNFIKGLTVASSSLIGKTDPMTTVQFMSFSNYVS